MYINKVRPPFSNDLCNVVKDHKFVLNIKTKLCSQGVLFIQWIFVSPPPQVNGRNLLSVDYDRSLRTEKIYDDHRKFLLKIIYDTQGHPTLWIPSSKLLSVNLTYSR